MDLSPLLPKVMESDGFRNLVEGLSSGKFHTGGVPLPKSARPLLPSALILRLNKTILYLVSRTDRMLTLEEEIKTWSPRIQILTFPEPNPLFYERGPWGPRTIRRRMQTLAFLTHGLEPGSPSIADPIEPAIILTTSRAVMTRTLPVREFLANTRWIKISSPLMVSSFLEGLVNSGYAHSSLVSEPGQFSRRGGIVDLWPPADPQPTRIELFGDRVDSLRQFDPQTQRSTRRVTEIRVTPAREGLPRYLNEAHHSQPLRELPADSPPMDQFNEYLIPWMDFPPAGLLHYASERSLTLVDDLTAFEQTISEIERQSVELRSDREADGLIDPDDPLPYLTLTELNEDLESVPNLDLGSMSSGRPVLSTLGDAFRTEPRFGGQLKPLMEYLLQRRLAHETTIVVSRQAGRLAELWSEQDVEKEVEVRIPDSLPPGELLFLQGALSEGWSLEVAGEDRLHLLTDAEIFGWARPQPRARPRRQSRPPEFEFADLQTGDFVVHDDFGIGQFDGLVHRVIGGLEREYLIIRYGGGDELYVPIHQADRVTKYIGVEGSPPRLSRLGTQEWERTRERAQESVEELAAELLQLYAKRATVKGHAYSTDTVWQRELEASFPYQETEDQIRALEEVKQDMESSRPMDRLVCGDVGYGKTEVALRAAFKAVMDGKQVAVLVPTTVLAQQHFHTFQDRLAAFPVEVEMLSRFRSHSEASGIIARLQSGSVDIVIGTHRLLQKDVTFQDLGLLIIDEEQRFGVTHKEALKTYRTEIDVLTMTATPIPRTLYMALTGIRDISTINTPPEERLPVITHVGMYDPGMIRQAILRELDRGGQVFFVHNRVRTIEALFNRVERLVPEARIVVAHGQMPESELEAVMEQFAAEEIDLLLSTSIIESGLDFPNANTLIVDRAEHFGLAQLYQLRGRVGRGPVRGYAYFFRHTRDQATEEALKRLEVIAENTQLGSGYSIAMRDLEMRGAGDILGKRQHGHIAAVGFHFYTRLLTTAVRKIRAGKPTELLPELDFDIGTVHPRVPIELPLPSALPANYITNRDLRLQLYRRFANLQSLDQVAAIREELEDRFGPAPAEVDNLIYQLQIKVLALHAQVEAISSENGQILIQIPEERAKESLPYLDPSIRASRRGLWLRRRDNPNWTETLREVLAKLGDGE